MAALQGIQGAGSVQEKVFSGNSFERLPAGGYVCRILEVKVDKTQKGKQYIKLRFDIAEGEYSGFFQKRWNADAQSQYTRKWKGIYKIFLPVFNGDNDAYMNDIAIYKGRINTIARCNNLPEPDIERGYDPDIFKNCLVGILFRDSMYMGNSFTEPAFLEDVQKIRSGDFEIPAPKGEKSTGTNVFTPQSAQSGGVFSAAAFQQPQSAPFQQPVQAQQNPFQQPAPAAQNAFQQPTQQTAQPVFSQPAQAYSTPPAASQQPALGDLSDFEEVANSGPVPF